MYLAALRRRVSFVSTYFAERLGVVGGGGGTETNKCYGQKLSGQKMTTKK